MKAPPPRLEEALAGRYRLEGIVGSGATASVYRAFDLQHQRDVAVKVLTEVVSSGLAGERFLREIRTAARLQHPHIVPLLESGQADGLLYYVMPWVEGGSLRARMSAGEPLPVPEVARILSDLADALDYAHRQGVIHRDIKPENVLLVGRHALVLDFGVAKALRDAAGTDPNLTTGLAVGTPTYMAPEQATAAPAIDHRADLYALGVLGYELLTGRPPFRGASPTDVLNAHVALTPEPVHVFREDTPPAMSAIIMRCLEKRPEDRWPEARALADALEPHLAPTGELRAARALPAAGAGRRRWLWGGLVAAGFVLVYGLGRRTDPASARGPDLRQLTFSGRVVEAQASPDGEFLAYVSEGAGAQNLWVEDLRSGSRSALASADWIGGLAWRSDGLELAFAESSGSMRTVKSIGRLGGPGRVAMEGRGLVSPSGRHVAEATPSASMIGIRDLGNGTLREVRLPAGFTWTTGIAWSWEGDRIAVTLTSPERGDHGVVVMDVQGGVLGMARDSAALWAPAWTPDGRSLFLIRQSGGRSPSLIRRAVSAGGVPQADHVVLLPRFDARIDARRSPFQDRLSARHDGGVTFVQANGWSNLSLLPAGGGDPMPITMGTATFSAARLSPDGSRLAFNRSTGTGAGVAFMTLGDTVVQESAASLEAAVVAWSPDGASIAMVRSAPDSGYVLSVHDVDRGTMGNAQVGPISTEVDWVGPDSLVVLMAGNRSLHLFHRTGGAGRVVVPATDDEWILYPRTSHDGRRVAYFKNRSGEMGLWVTSLDGGEREVASGSLRPVGWSSAGDSLFAADIPVGDSEAIVHLWVVPLDGGAARRAMALPPGSVAQDVLADGSLILLNRPEWRSDAWTMVPPT